MKPGEKTSLTPIKLLLEEYQKVIVQIRDDEGLRATLSNVLKREKGWTYRRPYYDDVVHIDFWNDSAKSMFLLTYSHLIPKSLKLYNKNTG
jgi:hypothetical protein